MSSDRSLGYDLEDQDSQIVGELVAVEVAGCVRQLGGEVLGREVA
jgi:hypothetical protein